MFRRSVLEGKLYEILSQRDNFLGNQEEDNVFNNLTGALTSPHKINKFFHAKARGKPSMMHLSKEGFLLIAKLVSGLQLSYFDFPHAM